MTPDVTSSGAVVYAKKCDYYGGVRLLVPVRHRLRFLAFPMRTVPLTRR